LKIFHTVEPKVEQLLNKIARNDVVELDAKGYQLVSENNKKIGKIRKTTTNSFIFIGKNKTAIAYFDTKGNLVLESYNSKTDTVTYETYEIMKK
jgi:hypothetical protein